MGPTPNRAALRTKKTKDNYWYLIALIFFAFFLTFIFSSERNQITSTGDLSFHLSRIRGLQSIFTSPINFQTFNSNGHAANIFYPYLTIIPATIINYLTQNLILSYKLLILTINLFTSLVCFYAGKKILDNTFIAFLFSAFYTFSAYRMTDVFYRSSLGESLALAFLPIILLAIYNIVVKEKSAYFLLSVGMSLIFYSHILSTLMLVVILSFFFLGYFFTISWSKRKFIFFELFKAAFLTLLLTIHAWGPMIRQYLFQKISRPAELILADQTVHIPASFWDSLTNTLSITGIGVLGLLSLLLPLLFIKKSSSFYKLSYVFSWGFWLFTTTLFPWSLLQNTPLNMIQYPWRFLGFQALFSSLSLALFFKNFKKIDTKKTTIIISLFLLASAISSCYLYNKEAAIGPTFFTASQENIDAVTSEGRDYYLMDYAPENALNYREATKNHLFFIDNQWQENSFVANDTSFSTEIFSNEPQHVILPIYNYQGTSIKVNNEPIHLTEPTDTGLVELDIFSGQNTIEVSYLYSFFERACTMVSIITLMISLVFWARRLLLNP